MAMLSRSLACSALALTLVGCTAFQGGHEKTLTSLYNCGDMPLSARQQGDGTLSLDVNGKVIYVAPIATADGTKYQNMTPPPQTTFWNKGEEATLEINGKTYPTCQHVKNSLYVDTNNYRAIGNGPSWYAIISNNELRLTTHNADKTLISPMPAPQMTLHGQYYSIKTDQHVMSMTIKNKSCRDSISNQYYPNEISIIFDGEVYKGCGTNVAGAVQIPASMATPVSMPAATVKPLRTTADTQTAGGLQPVAATRPSSALITKQLWIAKEIDGTHALSTPPVMITFGDDGSLVGSGGCNSLSGSYKMAGKTLQIEPTMTSTMMACAQNVMDQEKAFTKTLLASTLIELRGENLILSTPRRKTIILSHGTATPIKP